VFESVFVPGNIEKSFASHLKEKKIICSKDYYLGVMFRTDWSIEAFINQKDRMSVAGYCKKSLEAVRGVFDYLGVPTVTFDSLNEAELYANSIGAIQAMASGFIRQLSLGYPSVNIRRVSDLLFKNITLEDCVLNIGTGGERMTFAIDNLIEGSKNPGNLTLLKEFQDINISSVISYAEYIIRHSYKSVAVLGITYKGNQRNLILSPAITLADYLVKNGVRVFLNDPFFSKDEMARIVKGAEIAKFPNGVFSRDVLLLASDHNEYKRLSQSMLNDIKKKTKLVIDNCGIWSHLSFGNKIKYYQVGDGSLNLLK